MGEKPKLNFMSYVFMMYQSGLIALGRVENPILRKVQVELEEAGGIISILEIIEDKTKGNLSLEEERTLKMAIDSLRFAFVEESGKKGQNDKGAGPEGNGGKDKGGNGSEVH